jgi:hypothetical protein
MYFGAIQQWSGFLIDPSFQILKLTIQSWQFL